jgi:DNA-directed RNA polymerase subunit RPC12/RpoP
MNLRIGRLEVAITGAHATLAGRIDDGSPLAELVAQLPAGDVVIDTSGVTFVNSIGMREWIRLIRALRDRGMVTLTRVADVLITQMNLIPDLGASVTIASFHAQYVCNACGAESAPIVDAVAHADDLRRMKAPALPCPECGKAMELGDFPERYLTVFDPRARR